MLRFLPLLFFLPFLAFSQNTFPYRLALEEVSIPGLPGLHSFAFAQADGKWLIVGGRRDGLHARQPFNAFPAAQNNNQLYVLDIGSNQLWSASLSGLPAAVQEQLQSTNMNFHQLGDTLYITGGYAYSPSATDHITFPRLTTLIVSQTINAIQQAQPIVPFVQSLTDNQFALTGGQLSALGNTFYQVGGHRFDGRYNPMGNPTYTQTYSEQIRRFTISNSPGALSVLHSQPITDAIHLHRRDFNLLPMIYPGDSTGFMISAGVFQPAADLPYLYPVDIRPEGIMPRTGFNQYLSQYHSAHSSLYRQGEMHHLFWGGMSQYQYVNGLLVEDQQVPFVKTISRLTRRIDGTLEEFLLPDEMPGLRGASAEFIPDHSLAYDEMEILHLDSITTDSIRIGHILGGLLSPLANPFSSNQTGQTNAVATIYAVWLIRDEVSTSAPLPGDHRRQFRIWPNPGHEHLMLDIPPGEGSAYFWYMTDPQGRLIRQGNGPLRADGSLLNIIPVGIDYPAGVYQFTVLIDGVYAHSTRWIKQ